MKNLCFTGALSTTILVTAACSGALAQATDAEALPNGTPNLAQVLQADTLGTAAFAEWENGTETKWDAADNERNVTGILLSEKSPGNLRGVSFGVSRTPGPRHLRIGFLNPVSARSVLVRGGGKLSFLKATVPHPGQMDQEADWVPAQRLVDGIPATEEVSGTDYAIWNFPPGTSTRALRFTHIAAATDPSYAGSLGGAMLLQDALVNLAPQATAASSSNNRRAALVSNGKHDGWGVWDNDTSDVSPVISKENPVWVMLSWGTPVKLDGLLALWAGFSAADVQAYTGPATRHPRDASASDWKSIKTFTKIKNGYPSQLAPNRLDFDESVTTRAVRLRVTAVIGRTHPHVDGKTEKGKRIWLGELMALQSLGTGPLKTVNVAAPPVKLPNPPIPVKFTLTKPSFVTLVIEDQSGKRVRNLISETPFPAGANTAWWDGTDDLGRDVDAANHGLYRIPAHLVAPGTYRVRGLTRDAIEPRYEFSVYTPGTPPWKTNDGRGGWLTNHSAPQAALFLPGSAAPGGKPMVYLGSAVSEGGSGLAWVTLDGTKVGGRGWIGGNWTAAPYLARDSGPQAAPDIYAYVGSVGSTEKSSTTAQLRLTGLSASGDKPLLRHEFVPATAKSFGSQISGIAVYNGTFVVSLPHEKQLLFSDVRTAKLKGTAPFDGARGLAFDSTGRLLVLTATTLVRFKSGQDPADITAPQTLVTGLQAASHVTMDGSGNFYISDAGTSHQVKVFDLAGKPLRTIGKAGVPQAGPYDPLRMNNPTGLAIDEKNQLWVTENDFMPKRVSIWSLDGKLLRAFYGPSKYGGGGVLDTFDKTRFYYADESRGTMEFKLDWQTGQADLVSVLYRETPAGLPLAFRSAAPETALYHNGKRYFTNCYNSNPVAGHGTAFLFLEKNGTIQPIAALGNSKEWELVQTDAILARAPQGTDSKKKPPLFVWSDLNLDTKVQAEEVSFFNEGASGITMMPDLSFVAARVGDKAMQFAPTGFTVDGVPRYDLGTGKVLAEGVQGPASSGGNQALTTPDGNSTVVTLGLQPFSNYSLSGAQKGVATWSYPNMWPGLHASHHAARPSIPGELIGPTRLLGGFVSPAGPEVGPLWAINSNMGHAYVFTADGLFVATVFKDSRMGKSWTMPVAERNQNLEEYTLNDENFWPTISQSPDGKVYMVDGNRMALVRLDGLDSLQRLPNSEVKVTVEDLAKAQTYTLAAEAARQEAQGRGVLEVERFANAPEVNGNLTEWEGAPWVDIDKSGAGANFNSSSKPYDISATMAVAGDKLYVAYRTANDKLLQNSGELPIAPFKTGGALDLMLGTNPAAPEKRTAPVAGDLRLLVTQVKGKTLAVLYRAVVPGTQKPVPFSSPARTITLDSVQDVSEYVELAGARGNYEFSVPLAVLGLKPTAGMVIRGDLGVLRGDGNQTMARVYWSNKGTAITADVPSEAMLAPQLWGRVEFK